jgi:molecular chaperone DnaK
MLRQTQRQTKKQREAIDVKNEADSLVYQTEKSMKELGDKISGADKQAIDDALAALKKAIEGNNTDDIKAKTEALKNASYKIAEEIYKQQGAQGAAAGAQPGAEGAAGAGADANAGSANGGSKFDKGTADDVEYEVH